MSSTRRRLSLAVTLLALAGLGVLLARPHVAVAPDDAIPDPVAAQPPSPIDAPRPTPAGPETGPDPTLAGGAAVRAAPRGGAQATGMRQVVVTLPDGTPATSGIVLRFDVEALGSGAGGPTHSLIDSAPIGRDGVARIGPDDSGDAGFLMVAVPGWPNAEVWTPLGVPSAPVTIRLDEGLPFSGRLVDAEHRPIPGVPILLTGDTASPVAVLDEDIDLALHVERAGGFAVHVEGVTDADGRFRLRAPKNRNSLRDQYRVVSRDARWYVSTNDCSPIPDEKNGRDVGDLVAVPSVALDLRVADRDGKPVDAAYLRVQWAASPPVFGTWSFGTGVRHATTRVRFERMSPIGDFAATVVVTAPGFAPALARATVPEGLVEARVDLVLDRADDERRTGLAELTVPGGEGVAGERTPWSLEVVTRDESRMRVEIYDTTTWAAPGRINVRLPPGEWTLRLLPPARNRAAFTADTSIAARVTTRVTMTEPASTAPASGQ